MRENKKIEIKKIENKFYNSLQTKSLHDFYIQMIGKNKNSE